MAATALLKFTIRASGDGDPDIVVPNGQAGFAHVGDSVTVGNSDNTSVTTWKFEVIDVPPDSEVVLTTQGPGALSTFLLPSGFDVPGSYRFRLTVSDGTNTDVDIRCVCVPFPNLGIIAPPYQGNPQPLPLVGVGAKPDELNIGGQARGWMGTLTVGVVFMHQVLKMLDDGIASGATGPAGGDLTGTYPNPGVLKLRGAAAPAGSGLSTGNALKVIGPATLDYGPINLAGGANHVTGTLPIANRKPVTNAVSVSPFTLLVSHEVLLVDCSVARTINLHNPNLGGMYTFKDITGQSQVNPITLHRFGAELIEGAALDIQLSSFRGAWVLVSDLTNWHVLGGSL